MNAAIWARVSKRGDQDTANQLQALRQWAGSRGYSVVAEYTAEDSAYTGKQRAMLAQALQDARQGKYAVLLVWALDRLSREGIEPTLAIMRQFRERGVRVLSLQESWTDVPSEFQELLAAFFAWVAQQESKRKSERVKAALERRRAEGKPVGRQPGAKDTKPRRRAGYVARWERERSA